jgi:uncharacterized protein RhaS with RHS repeats
MPEYLPALIAKGYFVGDFVAAGRDRVLYHASDDRLVVREAEAQGLPFVLVDPLGRVVKERRPDQWDRLVIGYLITTAVILGVLLRLYR